MAAEYEPSARGFLDVFVPIQEPPHADYLVDDPLFLAQCQDYPSCIAASIVALVAIFFALLLMLIQLNHDHRSFSIGFERIRYILRRTSGLTMILMMGWVTPLVGQYNNWQLLQDFLLFNCSVVLMFAFSACWYEFFVITWEVHRVIPLSPGAKTFFWFPTAFCFVTFNVHLMASAMVNYVWPRIVLFWVVAPMATLCFGWWWIYTCRLTGVRKRPAEDFVGTLFKKYRMMARLHYTVIWGSLIIIAAVVATIYRASNMDRVGYLDRYWSLYMDDTLLHFTAAIAQSCGLLLQVYAAWAPLKEPKQQV